ncbi:MAG: glycosyltransferase family 1 protein, partial [Bacteroidales bacterium]|nr:glycosyltransferase family 1 protein [Bacteroidales bacterium]
LPVIHDINFMHRQRDLPFLKSIYFRKQFRKFAKKASRIATVSEYSKNDLINTWQLDPSKIDVVYNGVSEKFFPQKNTFDNNSPGKPYFLFVGNLSPRKNIPNLIRAYNKFRDRVEEEYRLVIAGERFFMNGEVDRLITNSDYKDEIILTGKKSPDELRLLYSNAIALVFVPWFEGFGIPLLEAMKCACPVICSDTTSMPEIAGDAAILVKPDSPEMIAEEMYRLISNPGIRESRIEIGYRQAEQFSWDNTASDLWNSVLKSLNIN